MRVYEYIFSCHNKILNKCPLEFQEAFGLIGNFYTTQVNNFKSRLIVFQNLNNPFYFSFIFGL